MDVLLSVGCHQVKNTGMLHVMSMRAINAYRPRCYGNACNAVSLCTYARLDDLLSLVLLVLFEPVHCVA